MNEFGNKVGRVEWCDLTVPNADEVRDFYAQVVGWQPEAVDMGDYADYGMLPPASSEAVAGVCFARGSNAKLPPQWLIYVTVADVDASATQCVELGGRLIDGPRMMGDRKFVCIEDPAGAVIALIEQGGLNG